MSDLALFLHLLGVLLFVSGIVLAGVGFEAARRRLGPAEVALLLGMSRVGALLVAVGAVIVLGFGLWLVHLEHFSYGADWIRGALVLYVAALVLGGLGGRRPKRARKLATELAGRGEAANEELRALLADRRSLTANYTAALCVLGILALMVFKP